MATETITVVPVKPRATKPTFQLTPYPPITQESYLKAPFEPKRHLAYHGLPKRYTMADIGHEGVGVSPIAVSEPFELFTKEAIYRMRNEVLSDEVWDNCRFASSIAACQLRGMAPKYAKFVYDAWTNPETIKAISEVAGINLIHNMEYEIGHINISVTNGGETDKEGIAVKPVVHWHKDSYPFVCVLMLSDATEMKGGETALRTGSGDIMKVRGPQMGSAVVLQGRYINHIALPSSNCRERITMVTSFRPKDPTIEEDSALMTVRPVSDLNELYNQWAEYRLEIVEERCRHLVKKLREKKRFGRKFDVDGVKAQLKDLQKFLEQTESEIVDMAEYELPEEKKDEKEEDAPRKKRTRRG
ncbi:hypothetical protein RUND412_010519 [Rhizina undulata]